MAIGVAQLMVGRVDSHDQKVEPTGCRQRRPYQSNESLAERFFTLEDLDDFEFAFGGIQRLLAAASAVALGGDCTSLAITATCAVGQSPR